MREPRPSDRVRVRDDLEVSPGSLDLNTVLSHDTLLGSVRVDVPAVHHVKGATEVVVLRSHLEEQHFAIWHVYPDPNHHVKRYPGHHEHGREMLEFPRLAMFK